ncbi:transcriptional regulator, LytTR family [Xylanibacter ruminicola]|uniref:Transcriptional regulator, LytTR family n=2 Tax=Xylanibacter ruminicola TaxID=839 RepID=A0A1M6THM1_XYLRU|nr:transcriptional regulator, LytTR family [Xylanibacter ruminicola]
MSILSRKYPFPPSSHWFRDCIVYCIIVFMILYLLQPFGFSMYQGSKLLVSLLFGFVTFGCCLVFGLAERPLHKYIVPWRIWHESLAILGMILFIGICNFLVFSVVFSFPITLVMFLMFLYWTLIIGVFVTICSVSQNYYRYLRNQLEALLDKTTDQQTDIIITIRDNNVRGNDLQIPINSLLYIEAQKNNVSVCYTNDDKIATAELHTTLAAVLDDLQAYQNIFQCHRSFVVNLNNITSAQGNSNGYQLNLGKCHTVVPVSRTYVPKLKSFIA